MVERRTPTEQYHRGKSFKLKRTKKKRKANRKKKDNNNKNNEKCKEEKNRLEIQQNALVVSLLLQFTFVRCTNIDWLCIFSLYVDLAFQRDGKA